MTNWRVTFQRPRQTLAGVLGQSPVAHVRGGQPLGAGAFASKADCTALARGLTNALETMQSGACTCCDSGANCSIHTGGGSGALLGPLGVLDLSVYPVLLVLVRCWCCSPVLFSRVACSSAPKKPWTGTWTDRAGRYRDLPFTYRASRTVQSQRRFGVLAPLALASGTCSSACTHPPRKIALPLPPRLCPPPIARSLTSSPFNKTTKRPQVTRSPFQRSPSPLSMSLTSFL